jgi:hypothetical protein
VKEKMQHGVNKQYYMLDFFSMEHTQFIGKKPFIVKGVF